MFNLAGQKIASTKQIISDNELEIHFPEYKAIGTIIVRWSLDGKMGGALLELL